ncbi:hypothetical protein BD779DRAFT_1519766 [Infundibulicybe gibba]|nr:hypothetical protein BD779DRAFT_1519766 [Infundibulicybe gibba]
MIVSPISSKPLLVGCWPATSASPLFPYYFSPTMITSSIMFAMTVYSCFLFLRDGVSWFVITLLVTTPDTIVTVLAQRGRPALLKLMIVIYSLIGSRVLLNIKTLLATNEVLGTTNSAALGTFGDRTTEFRAVTRCSSDCTIDLGLVSRPENT